MDSMRLRRRGCTTRGALRHLAPRIKRQRRTRWRRQGEDRDRRERRRGRWACLAEVKEGGGVVVERGGKSR